MRSLGRSWIGSLLLCSVMIITGCSKSQLDRAAKASGNLANYTGQVIDMTDALYTSGALSLALKNSIADKEIAFSKAGLAFNSLVIRLSEQYGDNKVPANVWSEVISYFDQLSKTFLDLVTLIPQAAQIKDSKAFRIISASVLALAQIMLSNASLLRLNNIKLPQITLAAIQEKLNWAGVVPATEAEAFGAA